jgi:hypothetical protein
MPNDLWYLDTQHLYNRLIEEIDHTGTKESRDVLRILGAQAADWLATHWEMEHSFPSPSNITACQLRTWFASQDRKRDVEPPPAWKIRAAMGVLQEPYWLLLLDQVGFKVTMPNEAFQCGEHMIAHPDAVLDDVAVTEFKSITGVGYKRLFESSMGVAGSEWAHYAQLQLEMFGAGKEYGLYLASTPDHSLAQRMLRQKKRYGEDYDLPPIYLEWVTVDKPTVLSLLDRAKEISAICKSKEPPLREADGRTHDLKGKILRPCGYCFWPDQCNDIEADRPEEEDDTGIEWDE